MSHQGTSLYVSLTYTDVPIINKGVPECDTVSRLCHETDSSQDDTRHNDTKKEKEKHQQRQITEKQINQDNQNEVNISIIQYYVQHLSLVVSYITDWRQCDSKVSLSTSNCVDRESNVASVSENINTTTLSG